MKRTSNWKRRIGFLLAPALAATTAIAASSNQVGATDTDSTDGNNTVDAADGEERFELCTPDFGNGKIFSSSFIVEGVDGKPLTDDTGLTFELTQGGNTIDVTEYVAYIEDTLDWTSGQFDELFDEPMSTYFEPIKAPGLFGLGCHSGTFTGDSNVPSYEPFPAGTTLLAKRSGITVATADLGGHITPWQNDNNEDPFLSLLSNIVGDSLTGGLDCDIEQLGVSAAENLFPCTPFSDMYNALIDATGVRLHPSFAYFITILPSLLVYDCDYFTNSDCTLEDILSPWILGAQTTAATPSSNPSITSLLHEFSSRLPLLNNLVSNSLQPKNSADNAVQAMIGFDYCIANRYLAILPLREPTDDQPPLFHLTSIGRGMADALSNPRVNFWPENDVCFYDQNMSLFTYVFTILFLQLYLTQLIAVDIPMGNATVITTSAVNTRPIQMKATSRIPWTWTDNTLAPLRVGKPYADAISANGSPAPTYSITSGALPAGLTLDSATGAITGTPKRHGTYTFTIAATNAVGAMSHSFTLSTNNVKPRLTAKRDNLLVTFEGRVANSFKGKRVSLQEYKYGKWITIERVLVKRNGTFTANTFTQWVKRYRVVAGTSRSTVITR